MIQLAESSEQDFSCRNLPLSAPQMLTAPLISRTPTGATRRVANNEKEAGTIKIIVVPNADAVSGCIVCKTH